MRGFDIAEKFGGAFLSCGDAEWRGNLTRF
jgi:hypothetical protein